MTTPAVPPTQPACWCDLRRAGDHGFDGGAGESKIDVSDPQPKSAKADVHPAAGRWSSDKTRLDSRPRILTIPPHESTVRFTDLHSELLGHQEGSSRQPDIPAVLAALGQGGLSRMAHLPTNTRGLLLSHVLPEGRWFGGERERDEIRFSSCCLEADRCEPGDLFIVLAESAVEAQQAVDRALQRGVGAVLSERVFPRPVRQFLVDDCRSAYGQLCHALLGTPAQSLRTLAVTGTFGKTVTRQLLASVLQAAGHRVGAMSSRRTASGARTGQPSGAARLAHMLADFRGRGGTHAVIDAARQSVAWHHLSGIQFDAAVVTDLGGAPTTSGGPIGRSFASGRQLIEQLKPGGFAVLNADDPSSKALLDHLEVPVLTVGLQRPADLTATLLERHPSEQTFLLETGDESHVVRTAMIGDDHLRYCLAAAAVGLVMGVSPNQIVQGLEAVESVPGRLQRIECGQPFPVYIDRSTNPSAPCAKSGDSACRLFGPFALSGGSRLARTSDPSCPDGACLRADGRPKRPDRNASESQTSVACGA